MGYSNMYRYVLSTKRMYFICSHSRDGTSSLITILGHDEACSVMCRSMFNPDHAVVNGIEEYHQKGSCSGVPSSCSPSLVAAMNVVQSHSEKTTHAKTWVLRRPSRSITGFRLPALTAFLHTSGTVHQLKTAALYSIHRPSPFCCHHLTKEKVRVRHRENERADAHRVTPTTI